MLKYFRDKCMLYLGTLFIYNFIFFFSVIPVTPLFPDEGRKKCCLQKSYGSGDYASAPWTKEDFIHPVFDPKEVLQNNAKKARNCTYAADALECIYSARGRKDLAGNSECLIFIVLFIRTGYIDIFFHKFSLVVATVFNLT